MDINLKIRLLYDNFQAGNLKQAENIGREILRDNPDNAHVLEFLGIIYSRTRDYDSAAEYLKKAVHLNPGSAETHYNLASVLVKKGNTDEAEAFYRKALQLDPDFADAGFKLAVILQNKGETDEAIAYYTKVLELNPDFVPARFNLGIAFQEKKRLDDAIACYRKVLQLNPQFAAAYYNLGGALLEKGQVDEAQSFYSKGAQLTKNIPGTPHVQGAGDKAPAGGLNNIRAAWQRCMTSLPVIYSDQPELLTAREHYRKELLDLNDVISRAGPEDIAEVAGDIGVHKPFSLAYQGLNDRELQRTYGELVCKIMGSRHQNWTGRPAMPPHAAGEPLRVGFASGFFYYHSVWKIPVKGWIENLDRDRFRLYGYYTGAKKDAVTGAARRAFHRFVEDAPSFEALCRIIRSDNLHVLIYPEIGMDPVTIRLAALRLAPVQCVSWGHPETSGFPSIDFFLSSELIEPHDAESHYTEKLIRLPNLSFYYTPVELPPVEMNREDFGLRPSAVLYHCCQALYKFLPQYDEVFPRIALEAGDCQFIFSSYPFVIGTLEKFHSRMNKAFERFNLKADDYVVFPPLLNPAQYQALTGLSDIFLDIIGWSGCNSVLEALACNLPVITLPTRLMRGREAYAVLTAMGAGETIAASLDGYVSLAVQLGRDPGKRKQISDRTGASKSLVYRDRTCISGLEDFLVTAAHERPGKDIKNNAH